MEGDNNRRWLSFTGRAVAWGMKRFWKMLPHQELLPRETLLRVGGSDGMGGKWIRGDLGKT